MLDAKTRPGTVYMKVTVGGTDRVFTAKASTTGDVYDLTRRLLAAAQFDAQQWAAEHRNVFTPRWVLHPRSWLRAAARAAADDTAGSSYAVVYAYALAEGETFEVRVSARGDNVSGGSIAISLVGAAQKALWDKLWNAGTAASRRVPA
jgi:hypothetical protein